MSHSPIHHVTAISGPAARNLDFYTRVLGLRLVKKTVNFDDPGTYHLYYGDEAGRPGTILTFFPWAHAAPGRAGVGETAGDRVPRAGERDRLLDASPRREGRCTTRRPTSASARRCCASAIPTACGSRWSASRRRGASRPGAPARFPAEHAIRGFHGVTLLLADGERRPARADRRARLRRGRAARAR